MRNIRSADGGRWEIKHEITINMCDREGGNGARKWREEETSRRNRGRRGKWSNSGEFPGRARQSIPGSNRFDTPTPVPITGRTDFTQERRGLVGCNPVALRFRFGIIHRVFRQPIIFLHDIPRQFMAYRPVGRVHLSNIPSIPFFRKSLLYVLLRNLCDVNFSSILKNSLSATEDYWTFTPWKEDFGNKYFTSG